MKILTAEQIREIDRRAIQEYGIPSLSLMQKAGEGIAEVAAHLLQRHDFPGAVAIVTGKGNNAGDGFAAAYALAEKGVPSKIFMLFPEKDLSKDARHFCRKARTRKSIRFCDVSTSALLHKNTRLLQQHAITVDAILGTGFHGKPSGLVAEAIDAINLFGKTIIAADVPSGLDAATGRAEKAVMADCTVTMGFFKSGFLIGKAMNHLGRVRVVDIGIPHDLSNAFPTPYHLLTAQMVGHALPRRLRMTHKGDYGHLLIVGGSMGMSGAPVLCAHAALRAGSGLVTVACPRSIQPIVAQSLPETMTLGLPENSGGTLSPEALPVLKKTLAEGKFDALVLGPGIGRDTKTQSFVTSVLSEWDIPMVVDADALYAVAAKKFNFKTAKSHNVILTPHMGEFARLTNLSLETVIKGLWGNISEYSAKNRCIVVLKSHITAISNGKSGEFINIEGNPGMATGGMGDVLSGVVGSFLGQGLNALDAATTGVFVHASAGDMAASHKGYSGLIASDVIEHLPRAILEIPQRRQYESI